jgi:hypothetical protein
MDWKDAVLVFIQALQVGHNPLRQALLPREAAIFPLRRTANDAEGGCVVEGTELKVRVVLENARDGAAELVEVVEVVRAQGEDDIGAQRVVVDELRQLPAELAANVGAVPEERNE